LAENKLFATLDTRARQLRLPSGRHVVLTDTVGFIRQMPKDLFAAFRSTFEEAADADLLLELIDASDPEYLEHRETTKALLEQLDLGLLPALTVFNKVDLLPELERNALGRELEAVTVAAIDKRSTDELLSRIESELEGAGRLPARDSQTHDSAAPV
jgi:GTPase